MKSKMAAEYFRFSWVSIVVLSIFSMCGINANETWEHTDEEMGYFNTSSISCRTPEELNECNDEILLIKKLHRNPQERRNRFKQKITTDFAEKIKPYAMPSDHPAKKTLDAIFQHSQPTKNIDALEAAGFEVVSLRPFSFAVIAKHPSLPGYLQKLYLDSEQRKKNGKEGWQWLVQRCEGAANIRKLIKEKNLQYFSVPDKWIYELPSSDYKGQPCILVVTDMDLVSQEESHDAWRYLVTEEHLDELYVILSHGFASSHVGWNIPYSKSGKFSCIDTEYAKRKPNYAEVEEYLSDEMKVYWRKLVKNGGKRNR